MSSVKTKQKVAHRERKAMSVRSKLRTYARRPRLCVFRSLKNIYCQIIDDGAGRTLAQASSLDKGLRESLAGMKKLEVAARVGSELAARAKSAGVTQVAFDRGHFRYHGRIKALADAARQGGLEF